MNKELRWLENYSFQSDAQYYVSNVLFNPLQAKRRLLYLKTQAVPRCKHFSSRL